VTWRKHSAFTRRSEAVKIAKMLRAPGDHRVRSRIRKEVYWRVEYLQTFGETR